MQRLPDAASGFVAVGPLLGNLHRQSLGGLVVDGGADERNEQRMRPGGTAL
jgi:hypothetical protein